jgi:DNA-directed RNA polymerase specialized sigma24 family protein
MFASRGRCTNPQPFSRCGLIGPPAKTPSERAVLLADAIKSLPPDHGEVIILRHPEGLPLSEVAVCMQRSVDSIK